MQPLGTSRSFDGIILSALLFCSGCATVDEKNEDVGGISLSISAAEQSQIDNFIANHIDPSTIVASIQTSDAMVDCVDALEQPALRHLREKTGLAFDHLQPPPDLSELTNEPVDPGTEQTAAATWQPKLGKLRDVPRCPDGTVAIRRLTRQEIAEYGSLDAYLHRAPPSTNSYEYARRGYNAYSRGIDANISLYNPTIGTGVTHSIAQVWLAGGTGANLETVEAGIIRRSNSKNAEIFIFATNDNYGGGTCSTSTSCCWNADCGFVIYPGTPWVLGNTFSAYATPGAATQFQARFNVYKNSDTGEWIFAFNGTAIGYWDPNYFSADNSGIRRRSDQEHVGGEVNAVNTPPHSATDMGSGAFASSSYPNVAFANQIKYRSISNSWYRMPDNVGFATDSGCYSRATADNDASWGNYLFFGGPGFSASCP
ncbi:MAG: hypothetical protein RL701_5578 [Pseudomonadota bacterium]|jgi:hypothetical protein